MIKVLVAASLYCTAFLAVEAVTKKAGINKEFSRKFVHVFAGTAAAFLPFFMSFSEIAVLSFLFIPVMLLSKKINFFSSIHEVERDTHGEVYFAVSIMAVAVLFPEKTIYIYSVLVMALSDGFASIIGQKYGHKKYRLLGSKKSYAGSAAFFTVALVLGFIALSSAGLSAAQVLAAGLLLSGLLTVVEGALSRGLDNLVLPPLAGLLLWSALNLLGYSI